MQKSGPMPLPDWYSIAALAERWHVTPGEVLEQPSYWTTRAFVLISAEAWVANERNAEK